MGRIRFELPWAFAAALLGVMGGWCVTAAPAEVAPTAGELFAGFRQNYLAFPSPRITWCYATTRGDAWYQATEKDSQRLAEMASAKTAGEKEVRQLLRQSRALKNMMAMARSNAVCFDYWTDRVSCQVRLWDPVRPGAKDGQPEFPDAPLTEQNLETVYQHVFIASYLPGEIPPCRLWGGISNSGRKTGGTFDYTIPQAIATFLFPPLGASDRQWGYNGFSEIDKFFSLPAEETRVVQKETIEGAACWVVKHVSLRPAGEDFAKHGKFEIADVVRAWIDPRRGCLPLRIEWYGEVYRDGAPFHNLKPQPTFVLRVNKIEKIDGAGFYPTEGLIETYQADPTQSFQELTTEEFVAGKTLALRFVVHQATAWFVKRIDPNAKLPRESLAFEFPNGTNYYDAMKGRTLIKGMSEQEYDDLIAEGGPPKSGELPSRTAYWVAFGVVPLAGLLAVWFILWYRARRS